MAYSSEAYDFSLFERESSAVPARRPRRKSEPSRRERKNIIEFPQDAPEISPKQKRQARPKKKFRIHPAKAIVMVLSFTLIFSTVLSIVHSQVKLTELTEQINQKSDALKEEKAKSIQLEMKATEKVNAADVEAFAKKELGMHKITAGQVIYMNMEREDKGTIIEEEKAESMWVKASDLVSVLFE